MSSQKSKSKSNFSKYTEDSKKQILKMEGKINQYIKIIEEMKNKNEIEIIVTNNENKDYHIKMKLNKEEGIDKIMENLSGQYPELKNYINIKKLKVNDNVININESLDSVGQEKCKSSSDNDRENNTCLNTNELLPRNIP